MEIHSAAYRHGATEEDIHHAWVNALGIYDIDIHHEPTKSLCIGPDTAGNLLELLYLQHRNKDLIIHAMRLRPVFRAYLTGE